MSVGDIRNRGRGKIWICICIKKL